MGQPLDEPAPEGVAGPGGINGVGGDYREPLGYLLGVKLRALRAQRHHEVLHHSGEFLPQEAGAVGNHPKLVLVADEHIGLADATGEGFRFPDRQRLSRVEDAVDAQFIVLGGELHHVGQVARAHDGHGIGSIDSVVAETGLVFHGPRVESGELIRVQVGGDVRPCGQLVLHDADVVRAYPALVQPFEIPVIVPAHAGQDSGLLTQQGQRIGDIARGAPDVLCQAVHQEADVDVVQLVGQDVVAEPPAEVHYAVVGHRAGNQNIH